METLLIIYIGIIAACVGSFLNVVIWRMPRGESLSSPPSHCPKCGKGIKWFDNIPVLSWLMLGGKCRNCKVKISAQYILIELLTAALVLGLYGCYYGLKLNSGFGEFSNTWVNFISHAVLICALLACSIIDIKVWHVPLEICWFASVVGIVLSGVSPNEKLVAPVGVTTQLASVGAIMGLIISWYLQKKGILKPSFEDEIIQDDDSSAGCNPNEKSDQPKSIAATSESGVNPRLEVCREVLYLLPAILGAIIFAQLYNLPVIKHSIDSLYSMNQGAVGVHIAGALSAVFGYLIGGGLIWGIRILGTLGFGKEAMGLGDVHILAAAGAVAGWIVPTAAFFLAPFFGLFWALYLSIKKKQTELPYGPWLSLGILFALVFYDKILQYANSYMSLFTQSR